MAMHVHEYMIMEFRAQPQLSLFQTLPISLFEAGSLIVLEL